MSDGQTPSQTVGPYFAYGLTALQYGYGHAGIAGSALIAAHHPAQIELVGQVFDGDGIAIDDALVEIWQADAQGHYPHPADGRAVADGFRGFGRCGTGSDARRQFCFRTVKPGRVDERQAPHINVVVFMRGLLSHAYTRIYFADEAAANAVDPVLNSVPVLRRDTLIAQREESGGGAVYRFDLHMQGARETVFFDV